jgi:CheY-like chemotaxis protein
MNVLIAENDGMQRRLACDAVADLGMNVCAADGGLLALETLAARRNIDLLVTDVSLPVIEGYRLVDMAKIRLPNLKIIYLAADRYEAECKIGRVHGEIIAKPYVCCQLQKAVARAFAATPGAICGMLAQHAHLFAGCSVVAPVLI